MKIRDIATTLAFTASIVLSASSYAQAQDTDKVTYTFGIVPQQAASRLLNDWSPLLTFIGEQANINLQFSTTKDIPTFESCLQAGKFDFAYMNPYHYVLFSEDGQYEAIAHQSDKKLRGLMVVRKEDPAQSILDLDGEKIAFPSPGAFGASIIPRAELSANNVEFEPVYVRSHDSVYRAVAAGLIRAGGGVTRTWSATSPEVAENLTVIYQTDGYTPHAIAAHKDVDDAIVDVLSRALQAVADVSPSTLENLNIPGFDLVANDAWDDVRGLNIDPSQAGIDTINEVTCPFE